MKNKKCRRLDIALSCFLSLAIIQAPSAFAQTVTSQSELEKRNAELDLAIKETNLKQAQQNLRKGSFLTPGEASKAPSGNTTANGVKIEGTTLAYEALGEVTFRIKEDLKKLGPSLKYLIIADQNGNSTKLLQQYQGYHNQLALFEKAFQEVLGESNKSSAPQPSFGGAVTATNLSLRGIIETLALFRTETTLQGLEVNIPEQDFVAQLAAQFRKSGINTPPEITPPGTSESDSCIQNSSNGIEIYYPSLYSLDIAGIGQVSPCQLLVLSRLDTLAQYQSRLKVKLNTLTRGKSVEDALKESTISEDEKILISEINDLNSQFNAFKSSLFQAQSSGITPLAVLANATKFGEMLSSRKGYLMVVNIQSGGTNRITRNILSSKVRYSGATIVSYMVYDSQGLIRLSDSIYHHTGFQKFNRDTTAAVSETGNATIKSAQ